MNITRSTGEILLVFLPVTHRYTSEIDAYTVKSSYITYTEHGIPGN